MFLPLRRRQSPRKLRKYRILLFRAQVAVSEKSLLRRSSAVDRERRSVFQKITVTLFQVISVKSKQRLPGVSELTNK